VDGAFLRLPSVHWMIFTLSPSQQEDTMTQHKVAENSGSWLLAGVSAMAMANALKSFMVSKEFTQAVHGRENHLKTLVTKQWLLTAGWGIGNSKHLGGINGWQRTPSGRLWSREPHEDTGGQTLDHGCSLGP